VFHAVDAFPRQNGPSTAFNALLGRAGVRAPRAEQWENDDRDDRAPTFVAK
jgi:hypothetical protein